MHFEFESHYRRRVCFAALTEHGARDTLAHTTNCLSVSQCVSLSLARPRAHTHSDTRAHVRALTHRTPRTWRGTPGHVPAAAASALDRARTHRQESEHSERGRQLRLQREEDGCTFGDCLEGCAAVRARRHLQHFFQTLLTRACERGSDVG
eukprot:2456901-Rhodomonas_salina.1